MTELTDQQLLQHFLGNKRVSALETLIQRYGPLVKGVCTRVLDSNADSDDLCQETFLIFAKQAASIRSGQDLSSWFYGVALRCASRLKRKLAHRRKLETTLENETMCAGSEKIWQELRPVLDEEIGRISAKYQQPIIHCYLEGKSEKEAALHLGIPFHTLRTRLARGRDALRKQLVRRGVTISAAALTSVVMEKAASTAYALSEGTVQSTLQAVTASSVSSLSAISALKAWLEISSAKWILSAGGLALAGVVAWTLVSPQEATKSAAPVATAPPSPPAPPTNRPADTKLLTTPDITNTEISDWEDRLRQAVTTRHGNDWLPDNRRDAVKILAAEFAGEDFERARALFDSSVWGIRPRDRNDLETERESYVYAVFAELGRRDPERGWDLALKYPEGKVRNSAIPGVVSGWAEVDPQATAKWLESLPKNISSLHRLHHTLAYSWLKTNPEAAFAWAKQLPPNLDRVLSDLPEAWGRLDPLAAAAWAEKQPDTIRGNAIHSVASGWAGQRKPNPGGPEAAAWLAQVHKKKMIGLEELNRGLDAVLFLWCETDPEGATAWVFRLPPDEDRDQNGLSFRERAVVRVIGSTIGTQAARNLIDTLPAGPGKASCVDLMCRQLGWRDPRGALAFIDQMLPESGGFRSKSIRTVFYFWGLNNPPPNEVFHVARQLPDTDRLDALNGFFEVYGVMGAALPFWNQLPDAEKAQTAPALARSWARAANGAGLIWVNQMPEGEMKQKCLIAQEEELVTGTLDKKNGYGTMPLWYGKQPRPGDWMTKLPACTITEKLWQARVGSAGQWPESTAKWLASLPAGKAKDLAIGKFSEYITDTNPVDAIRWASSIQDPTLRDKQITSIVEQWEKTDQEAATHWIAQSSEWTAIQQRRSRSR